MWWLIWPAIFAFAVGDDSFRLEVDVAKPLRVPIGRQVALTADHLRIRAPGSSAGCRVVAVRGGSFSERVGKLEPGVFSCNFAENGDRITYSHSGSPLLTNDSIALRVFAFSPNSTESPLIRDVTIEVEVTARPKDKLVVFGAAKGGVEVVLSGLSEDFDKLRMAFSYDIADNVSCTLTYNTTGGATFPAKGQLVDKLGKPLDFFAIDCWEFAFSGMRYRHLKPFSPSIDYIPLTARVVDGAVGRVIEQENVFIPVRVIGALENYPPQVSASSALKLVLKSPYLTLFTSEVLSFVDWDANDVSRLVVNISQQPPLSLGHFVNLLRPTERVHSFTVGDLDNKLIAFQPAPRAGSDSQVGTGEAKFVAYDELFAMSEQVTVQISLAYSSNSFPRARVRQSLYVLRGKPQPITVREVEFVAPTNPSTKESFKKPQIQRIYFEKPKCGKILRRQSSGTVKEATSFSLADLNSHAVVYNQTAMNCSSDFVIVHIQDDFVELRLGVPVYIVPRAIEPPVLVENKPFIVRQALQHVLNGQHLKAVASDNSTENRCRKCVTYRVVKMPKFGSLESSSNASLGSVLQTFTQGDIDDGFIRYQHSGANVDTDEIVLRLEDDELPVQNVGPDFALEIQVRPYSPEKSSTILSNSNVATLNESDFLILSEKHLKYKYQAASDREIEYVVVKPPYFLESDGTRVEELKGTIKKLPQGLGDAGKLVIFSSGNMPSRRSSEQIVSFTQSDVKDGRVAYFAPNSDIGSRARVAQFVFDVKGPEGVAKSQVFKINILPINNRPPRVHETALTVRAGQAVGLLPAVRIDDADSPVEKITIAIEQTPKHGDLVVNGTDRLSLGDKILFEQLGQVTYQHHQHSSDRSDQFRLMAFDGQYHSSGTIAVTIQQPDILDKIFLANASVGENERVVLTVPEAKEFISKRFPGNASMKLKFLVVRPPFHGKLMLDGKEVRKFYSKDLVSGQLTYVHPSQAESGFSVFEDSLTILGIASSADLLLDSHQLLLRTISVKITPKDNRPPNLQFVGMPQLFEGQSTRIDSSMISVDDVDSHSANISLEVVSVPKLGCLSMVSDPNSTCLTPGQVIQFDEFHLGGGIVYNQTNSTGHEATRDSFEIRASDGTHQSEVKTMTIEILPETDEAPSVEIANSPPTIEEGGEVDLAQLFTVTDLDRPGQNLTLTFVELPKFGSISVEGVDNQNLNLSVPFRVEGEQPALTYQHDGSETFADSFVVQVTDGKFQSAPTRIDVKIVPIDDEKPNLVRNGVNGELFRLFPPGSVPKKIALTSDDIQVRDVDTLPGEIAFSLMEKPHLFTLMLDNVMASSFTQLDIDLGRLYLMVPTTDFSAVADGLKLSASSGKFDLPEMSLAIRVIKENGLNVSLELVAENLDKPFEMPKEILSRVDGWNLDTLVFKPVNSSGDECFSFSDSSFSLASVKAGTVVLKSGDGVLNSSCQQSVLMALTHLPSTSVIAHAKVNFANTRVETVVEPEVTYGVAQQPGVIERLAKRVFGFVLTTEHLHTVSSIGDSKRTLEDAIYEVTRAPAYGILADLSATTSTLESLPSFSQPQIDGKQIVYVLTKLVHTMTNDSFEFNVLDGSTRRPLLTKQQFIVEWSFVEFEQDQLIGCEMDGHVLVPVRRVGFTNSSATVHIRLKHPQLDEDDERQEIREEELKFEPGSTKLVLNVKIDSESMVASDHGPTRSIRALLRSPINTLLGSSRKISIRVISSNRAPCNNSRTNTYVQPVETVDSFSESRRVFNLRSKMLQQSDDEDGSNKRPSRSNKSCQTGWMPLQNLAKTCYAQLPLSTNHWDAHRRCKALGGRLPTAATMTPALLHELSEISANKPLWVDAPNLVSKTKSEFGGKQSDSSKSCAIVRNMAIALRRCAVAKARVICITDL